MRKEPGCYHYRVILSDISQGKGEAFEAYVPAFQSYHLGETPSEALSSYQTYFLDEKKRREKADIAMPTPDIEPKQKQVPVRLNVDLYERISTLARQRGTSFNKFVVQTLEHVRGK